MSVVKSKRKESQFEVFHHFTKMRKKITDLLLRDFGYSYEKSDKKLSKIYEKKELTDSEKRNYERQKKRKHGQVI